MKPRTFDNIIRIVREAGDDRAQQELDFLLKIGRSNFAACYGAGTGGPDAHDCAIGALLARIPVIQGCGQYLEAVCDWLYAPVMEVCCCGAPGFITGCDYAVASGNKDGSRDLCVGSTHADACKCPWVKHTRTYK